MHNQPSDQQLLCWCSVSPRIKGQKPPCSLLSSARRYTSKEDWRAAPWHQQCQVHQCTEEPGNPWLVPVGHILHKGDVKMSLFHEPSGETVSGDLWKEPDQEVLAFRARPIQGAPPSWDHTGSTTPGLVIKPWSWAPKRHTRTFHMSMQSRWGTLEIKDRLQLLHKNHQWDRRTSCRKEAHHLSGSGQPEWAWKSAANP